jgi:RNA polymerase sigma factor (sigma-70 family)
MSSHMRAVPIPSPDGRDLTNEAARPFEEFFELEHGRLFGALTVMTGDRFEAEEVMQEAFLKLWERWTRVSRMDEPVGFLYRTAMNLYRKRLRRTAVALRRAVNVLPQDDALAVVEARDEAARLLRELTPREREVVVLTRIPRLSDRRGGTPSRDQGEHRPCPHHAGTRIAPSQRGGTNMSIEHDLVERAVQVLEPPAPSFERLVLRRERKQRNRRIGAGAVGIAVFAAIVFGLARATWSGSDPGPAEPQPSPSPSIEIERSDRPILREHEVVLGGVGSLIEAVDLETGDRRTLVGCEDPCAFFTGSTISADGRWLAYTMETCVGAPPCESDAGLWVANDRGEQRQLVQTCERDRCFPLAWDWSPTGATLAVAGSADGPSGPRSLFLVDPRTGERTEIADPPSDLETVAWSPDGSRIAYDGGGNVSAVSLDGGSPALLAAGRAPSWSPDGSRLALTGPGEAIYVLNADGSNLERIADGYEAAWSPDGARIVTHVEEGSAGGFHEELWVVSVDGSGAINILPPGCCTNGIVDDTLTWSPNGTRIAFMDGSEEIWRVVNSDGAGTIGSVDTLEVASWRSP